MAKTDITYEDIKNAVFYSQQKPELLADIIADIISSDGDDDESEGNTPKGE